MSKKWFIFLSILVLTIMGIILFGSEESKQMNYDGLAKPNNPVKSTSGKYELKIVETNDNGVNSFMFIINSMDGEKKELFRSEEKFRVRDTLYFLWDENDKVWVYSGDVGTFIWTKITDDNWEKQPYAEVKDLNPPELLKKLKPKYFK